MAKVEMGMPPIVCSRRVGVSWVGRKVLVGDAYFDGACTHLGSDDTMEWDGCDVL